jgi:hypothetical protein
MTPQEMRAHYYVALFQRNFAKHNIRLTEVTFDDLIPDSLKKQTETGEENDK